MALAYVPPGVTVEEYISNAVTPILAANAQICLVGIGQGYYFNSTTVNVTADADTEDDIVINAPLGTVFHPGDSDFESVRSFTDATAGSGENQTGFVEGTDYTSAISTDNKTITVTPVADKGLDSTGVFIFTYRLLPENYFLATRHDSMTLINQYYGPAFNADGTIACPLSAAAYVAFQNGAQTVVVQPLYWNKTEGSGDTEVITRMQPTSETVPEENGVAYFEAEVWDATLEGLRDIEDINILVPVVGQGQTGPGEYEAFETDQVQQAFYAIQDHIWYMAQQGQLMIGIFGEDGTANAAHAPASALQNHAQQLRQRLDGLFAEQCVMVSPSRFRRAKNAGGGEMLVGGQYVAAAISGMIAARPTTQPLTRKPLIGFTAVADARDKAAKNADAQAGLMVIEQKGNVVQVRHGLTLDNTATARRELSVVRAKHRMIESIRDTLESQVIGEVPADGNASMVVRHAVIGVLELLRDRQLIIDYNGVQTRTLTNDPTTVECRFSYRPAFPLNYIHVVFSLDLSAVDITSFEVATI